MECGAAFYEMGNPFEAMASLKHALENYTPGSHRLAVTRWLLGIVAMVRRRRAHAGRDQLAESH